MKKKLIILILFILSPFLFISCGKDEEVIIYYTDLVNNSYYEVDFKNPLYMKCQVTSFRNDIETISENTYEILKEFNKTPLTKVLDLNTKNNFIDEIDYSIQMLAYYNYKNSNTNYDITLNFNILYDGTLLVYQNKDNIYYSKDNTFDFNYYKELLETKYESIEGYSLYEVFKYEGYNPIDSDNILKVEGKYTGNSDSKALYEGEMINKLYNIFDILRFEMVPENSTEEFKSPLTLDFYYNRLNIEDEEVIYTVYILSGGDGGDLVIKSNNLRRYYKSEGELINFDTLCDEIRSKLE